MEVPTETTIPRQETPESNGRKAGRVLDEGQLERKKSTYNKLKILRILLRIFSLSRLIIR